MDTEELIRILQTCPPDLRVVVSGYEEGYDDLERHLISVKEIRLDAGAKWWEGRHRDVEDDRTEGGTVVNALVLQRPVKQA